MSNNKLRAGIIGLGRMGVRHYQAYNLIPDYAKVIAVCDILPEAVTAFNRSYPEIKSYTNWEKMIGQEELDILSVVTHGPSHAEIVISSAEAKIPRIICEKPMATRMIDAQKMIDVCKVSGSILMINHTRRWSPAHIQLKKLLQEGIIGNVCSFICSLGGGRLGCNGSHIFDLMRMLSDSEPEWIVGFIDQTGTPNPRGIQFKDPGGYGIIGFKNGIRGFLEMSEDIGVPDRIEIIGNYGRIIIDEGTNQWEILARSDEDKQKPITSYGLPLKTYHFGFDTELDIISVTSIALKELCKSNHISCSGEDGKASLEMVIAFHLSHLRDNTKVSIPLQGDDLLLELQIT